MKASEWVVGGDHLYTLIFLAPTYKYPIAFWLFFWLFSQPKNTGYRYPVFFIYFTSVIFYSFFSSFIYKYIEENYGKNYSKNYMELWNYETMKLWEL